MKSDTPVIGRDEAEGGGGGGGEDWTTCLTLSVITRENTSHLESLVARLR